ncbi:MULTISPECIES: type II toxin-antitoxin system antitoxin DNA ADP-ribosyl glycohydrolase DarG [unclassified Halomonas]|uniref:type II toxin-antitoxin system antitoxin DNA ADP-ribosyl glycohydrolase DarG n=1 Tax=unclassified Halomonas TaxID=2609666 RepID=UPI0009BDAEFD|nr:MULTISPECIES: macro domain-containing protein [unclassified Halomonas]NGO90305.1 Appr-1-p processing protein [Halomonas sp.]
MIETTQGNLLEADAEALVNTVNCVGVMGKGIALQFKQAFPENFSLYARVCKEGGMLPGKMLVFETGDMVNPKYIINFPTKRHWKGKSKMEDIDAGLVDLVAQIKHYRIRSIAIPPLGAGLGGLNWADIKPRIEQAFADLPDVRVLMFEPKGAPPVEQMPVRTKRPKMTPGRALLIRLLDLYGRQGYRHSLLEVQKLAYFLQAAGEPMRLQFTAHHLGPYADNLNHALQRMEGHFIRGYGDRSGNAEIRLMPGALEEAQAFLENNSEAEHHLERVKALIEGFETPYGMELLSTIHWIVTHEPDNASSLEHLSERVAAWNHRKKQLMKPKHIHKAYARIEQQGWASA